jgi:hypothetical protein
VRKSTTVVPLESIRAVGLPPMKSGTSHSCGSRLDTQPGHATPLITLARLDLVLRRCCVHGPVHTGLLIY